MRAPEDSSRQIMLGVLSLAAGVFVFSVQDAILKGISARYPLSEALFFRTVVAIPILFALVLWTGGVATLRTPRLAILLVRAVVGFGAYVAYYLALPALPLADAVALFFAVPLIIAALSGPFLGERVRPLTWLAIAIGVAGVIVMLRPGSGLFQPAALLSLLAAFLYASQQIIARRIGATETAAAMSFHQNLVFFAGAALAAMLLPAPAEGAALHPSIFFLTRPWLMPSAWDLALMLSTGVIASAGTVLLTEAYRRAPANVVAIYEYTGLIWAPLWGFLFFFEVPAWTTVAGGALIVVAGLIALAANRA